MTAAANLLALAALSSCNDSIPVAVTPMPVPGAPIPAAGDELREPEVLSAVHGVLDLLVVAKAAPIAQFAPYHATGWVYEICPRPSDDARSCPTTSASDNLYGGTRLQLSPGDLLKIRLVNRLPPDSTAAYWQDSGNAFLALNPTNLHTHGMLVSPRYATAADPTWGDNVFLYNFNTTNGMPEFGSNLHGVARFDVVDYSLAIPPNHPSGLYWFHPHIHGISEHQISAGLSGIITIGQISDYACSGTSCAGRESTALTTRHLILKDTQVLSNGSLLLQQDWGFCAGPAPTGGPAPTDTSRRGGCPGAMPPSPTEFDYTGGRWFFTINGQQYPQITVDTPAGQIWRIVNASASATYHLNLRDRVSNRQMLMRVISIDGVAIDVGPQTDPSKLISRAGNRFQPIPCPGADGGPADGACTTELHLMPSSRAEVWVTYRDASGAPQVPLPGTTAVLRSSGHGSDPLGGSWPEIELANVQFAHSSAREKELTVTGQASILADAHGVSVDLRKANATVPSDSTCSALAPGHMRRIIFGTMPQPPHMLGLGYEELDAQGVPVPGTFVEVTPFDPTTPTVCIPLEPGNQPTTERWQLINIMDIDHNFHIHQVRFSVLTEAEAAGSAVPDTLQNRSVLMDSLPLPHAEGACASVADWRAGACTAHPATAEITFAIAGDFVYHCHILAHEDAGMMAVIRVRSDPSARSENVVERFLSAARLSKDDDTQPRIPRIGGVMCRDPRGARRRGLFSGSRRRPLPFSADATP